MKSNWTKVSNSQHIQSFQSEVLRKTVINLTLHRDLPFVPEVATSY